GIERGRGTDHAGGRGDRTRSWQRRSSLADRGGVGSGNEGDMDKCILDAKAANSPEAARRKVRLAGPQARARGIVQAVFGSNAASCPIPLSFPCRMPKIPLSDAKNSAVGPTRIWSARY